MSRRRVIWMKKPQRAIDLPDAIRERAHSPGSCPNPSTTAQVLARSRRGWRRRCHKRPVCVRAGRAAKTGRCAGQNPLPTPWRFRGGCPPGGGRVCRSGQRRRPLERGSCPAAACRRDLTLGRIPPGVRLPARGASRCAAGGCIGRWCCNAGPGRSTDPQPSLAPPRARSANRPAPAG